MIAADTSAWVDFSKGIASPHARRLEACLKDGALVLPMHVLFEVLSGPGLTREAHQLISMLPKLEIHSDFWERASKMRRSLLKKGLKARSMDTLIAQNCIDHGVSLIVADQDFRHFKKFGLKLV
ncbi:MAG: PIN domain-containing protein [Bdellovibrionales bacterium]|nr:PIN domain-containing protein [Bdellovibrionales bacterium]